MKKLLLACWGAALLLPALAGAQRGGVFGELVNVELVVVDVLAEDSEGRPVLDLKVDEFRLFEDGQPVEIEHFDPAAGAGPSEATGETRPGLSAPGRPGGRMIIFIDNMHTSPHSRLKSFARLAELLDRSLSAEDEVMVAAYNGEVEVLLPMTRNRSALRRVLREHAQAGAINLLSDLESERILQLIETRHQEMHQTGGFIAGDACVDLGFLAHTHAEQVHGRVLRTIGALEGFVDSLAGYPGRKSLLHVSDGVPLVPGIEAYRFASELCDGTGASKGIENAVDTALFGQGKFTRWDPTKTWSELVQFNTSDEWTRLAAHANTYQVSFYTVQAASRTHRASGVNLTRVSLDTETEGARNVQDPLFLLADETGGAAMLDSPNLETVVGRVVEESRLRYQLAYTPPDPGDGRQHRIRVEVTRPDLRLRHRKSYRSKTVQERVADGVVSSLLHGHVENPLNARLEVVGRSAAQGSPAGVRLQVRVPLASLVLLPGEGGGRALFSVFVAARGERGEMTPVGQKTVPLRVAAADVEREYVYEVEIGLRSDRSEVAVAIRDEIGGEASYLRASVGPTTGP